MCGIVGYIGRQACVPILMGGLGQVEYRGYDSAGIAVITPTGAVKVHRRAGKLATLADSLPKRLAGRVGIGHTRWATHGAPTDINAHPHVDTSGRIAIVHNGIIENAADLRRGLEADGVVFASETDSECFAHLIAAALEPDMPLEEAVRHVLAGIEGTYGLLVVDADQPDRIVVARRGSPIVIGIGDREMLVASDIAALVRSTRQVVALADGEMAVLTADGYRTFALEGTPTQQRPFTVDWDPSDFTLDGHTHFMHKEIAEQPAAISRALLGRIDERHATAKLGGIDLDARTALAIRRVVLLGCGTAYYAGMAGAQLIEDISRIPATAEPAAEFGYRNPVIERDALYIALSQSGETADTLEAVQEIKRRGGRVIALVNVVGSTIARECDGIYLHSGPEISVASTKAFTSMLAALSLLALHLGRVRDLGPGRAGAPDRGPAVAARRDRVDHRRRGADQGHRRAIRVGRLAVLHRAPPRLPDRARGRAEAQGDLLHPRRGVPGQRAQARAAGADRARLPERRAGAGRRPGREEHLDDPPDPRPQRPRHRRRPGPRRRRQRRVDRGR